jgi:hypothetical protein
VQTNAIRGLLAVLIAFGILFPLVGVSLIFAAVIDRVVLLGARAHAFGRRFYSGLEEREVWEIQPMVGMEDRWSDNLNSDRGLKKDVTSGMKGMIVRIHIPPDGRMLDKRARQIVAGPGDAFIQIERCHLSSGFGPDYGMHLEALEDNSMRHDIAEEFRLLGCLAASGRPGP